MNTKRPFIEPNRRITTFVSFTPLVASLVMLSLLVSSCTEPTPIVKFKVTINPNGGEYGSIKEIEVEKGNPTRRLNESEFPKLPNYLHTGWNTQPDGNGNPFVFGETLVNENITVYAQWKGENREITLNKNYGPANEANLGTHTIQHGSTFTAPSNLPTRTDYIIGSWNEQPNGSGNKFVFGTTPVTKSATIYAIWKVVPKWTEIANESTVIGKNQQFTIYLPQDAGTRTIEWRSSDNNIATVAKKEDNTAEVTTVGAGSVTITASVSNVGETNSEVQATIKVQPFFLIPDTKFKEKLKAIAIVIGTTWIKTENKEEVLDIDAVKAIQSLDVSNGGISNLRGIEYFTSLTSLVCYTNPLTNLDLSKNTALKYLDCSNAKLKTLDVSALPLLDSLKCIKNKINELRLDKNPNIKALYCNDDTLTTLDVSKNTQLTTLLCYNNYLISLDLRGMRSVSKLNIITNDTGGSIPNSNNSGIKLVKVHVAVATHGELKSFVKTRGLQNMQVNTYTADPGSTTYTQAICDFDPETGLRVSPARTCTLQD
ncbi:hypothetical protein CHS0354_023929 [Potamilus streckersoni]|uniref:BIG2 domain-containing protein n=1 Tax=Potamilus streckersoni TaxID=2493646 RepID=A0AAE0RZX9_9BIVA|nr:hypothetical protein CHS0354_023929 [Potamilus streckersoni]